MIDITFLPIKRAPKNIKEITYHVDEENNIIAVAKAKQVFMMKHDFKYYDKVTISGARVL